MSDTRKRRKEIDDRDLKRVMKLVAANVNELRKSQKLSQQVLATRAKISTTTLSDIEACKAYNLKLSTLVSLARELGISDITKLLK